MTTLEFLGSPNRLATPAGDFELSDAALNRIQRAPSENTKRAYRRWAIIWDKWCREHGRTPLPATAETLAEFVSDQADRDLGMPSLHVAVAAIRSMHALAGHEDQPGLSKVKYVLRAHAKDQADKGGRSKQATPILLDALQAMLEQCPTDSARDIRNRAILLVGWAGMLRRSELVGLLISDITETSDGLTVYIARSKTDKDAKGATVLLPRGSHPVSDPTAAVAEWKASLASKGIVSGKLLRSIGKGGGIAGAMSGAAVNEIVKGLAHKAKLPNADRYTAHSLRAGGATWAYRKGAVVSTIANHGRWAPNSPVVLGYIRAVDKWKDNPMRGVGL